MSREFLVTKLVCAKCGGILTLGYPAPAVAPHAEGQPPGAAMVETRVAVEPCTACTRPLEDVRDALRVLSALQVK